MWKGWNDLMRTLIERMAMDNVFLPLTFQYHKAITVFWSPASAYLRSAVYPNQPRTGLVFCNEENVHKLLRIALLRKRQKDKHEVTNLTVYRFFS